VAGIGGTTVLPVHDGAAGVTDLLLGAVLLGCALRLRMSSGVHRYWPLAFGFAGLGAWAGVLHHLVFAGSSRASNLSWIAVGVSVAIAISYLLAGTATELLRPSLARLFIRIRIGGLLAYVVVIATVGIGRSGPLVASESVTMASIVGLWVWALRAGHPRAPAMLVAIITCAASSAALAVPATVLYAGLDGRSLQHLAQIPGVLLLYRAIHTERPEPHPAPRATAEPGSAPAG
jgi:hypothetical protein